MKKLLTITCILLISLSLLAQEKIYFPCFEVFNLHQDYQYSASKLLKSYVDNENKYIIILPERKDSVYKPESNDLTQIKAKGLNAPYFLKGELNALNEVMLVTLTLYRTDNGQKVWSDMMKARTPDDLDPILNRMAKVMGTNKKAAEAGDIYSVSDYESKELGKITATYNWGISVGGAATIYPGLSNVFSGGFGLKFAYDIRDIILNINGEYYWGSYVDFYNINLSTLYPFKKGKNTPYIGAGLAYGGNTITTNNPNSQNYYYYYDGYHRASGLIILLHGGYIFNRTASAHMQVGASLYIPTYKVGSTVPVGGLINIAFLF